MNISRILLVEDEAAHVNLFRRNIKRVRPDVEILVAANGQEGLDVLKTVSTDGLLILLDLNMPIMTGHEMLAAMHAVPAWKNIAVAILTTSDYAHDQEQVQKYKIVDYLIKPVSSDQLAKLLTH